MSGKKSGMFARKHKVEDLEQWLMTYADMITLLLCFFVIIVSMSEPKKERFEQFKESMLNKFSTLQVETPFTSVYQNTLMMIEQHQAERDMVITETDRGLEMELSSSSFFEPGSAVIRPDKLPLLDQMAQSILAMKYKNYVIEVEGHTDNSPINTQQFPSNWELSAARATAVIRHLITQGIEAGRMRATAYGDVRPKVPNTDADGNPIPQNQELNRRVMLKLERKN